MIWPKATTTPIFLTLEELVWCELFSNSGEPQRISNNNTKPGAWPWHWPLGKPVLWEWIFWSDPNGESVHYQIGDYFLIWPIYLDSSISHTHIYTHTDAPSPLSLPLIGHIYLLAKYPTNPWKGFNAIREQYGDVVRIQLGVYRSIMVSSLEAIREVLLVKGDAFSNRPHFDRHAIIFGNNQQNGM